MLTKILEKLDDLFTVKQTKFTRKRIFFSLTLAVLVVFSLPIYFMYEDYAYDKYSNEYMQATELINEYVEAHGEYPLGERIQIHEKEKELYQYFKEMNLPLNRDFYYIDLELLPQFKDFKHTYIIDTTYNFIFTGKSVVYKMTRWHYAR